MTPRNILRDAVALLEAAGVPDSRTDASLLLSSVTGIPALSLRLDTETELTSSVLAHFDELLQRRITREPLQYILGEVSFYGRTFQVDPRVLIPRSETELLCEWALEKLRPVSAPKVLDLCCGSGCIGLTVKAERQDAAVTLSDISRDALDVTVRNASGLSLNVETCCGDLFSAVHGRTYDLILSNPPYIPSDECPVLQAEVLREPVSALDGGADGLDFYRRIVKEAPDHLTSAGMLLMEIGIGETDRILDFLTAEGFSETEVRKDYAGIDRMVFARLG